MKIIVILIALLFGSFISEAEVIKGRAHNVAFKEEGKSWSENSKCSVLLTFTDDKVKVFAKSYLEFDIAERDTEKAISTSNPNDISMIVVDNNGVACKIQITSNNGNLQLYIIYTNVSICYDFTII